MAVPVQCPGIPVEVQEKCSVEVRTGNRDGSGSALSCRGLGVPVIRNSALSLQKIAVFSTRAETPLYVRGNNGNGEGNQENTTSSKEHRKSELLRSFTSIRMTGEGQGNRRSFDCAALRSG
jgi:hypothetical protein